MRATFGWTATLVLASVATGCTALLGAEDPILVSEPDGALGPDATVGSGSGVEGPTSDTGAVQPGQGEEGGASSSGTSGAVCTGACSTDLDCQANCQPTAIGIYCCDTPSGTCMLFAGGSCPAPAPVGSGTPPPVGSAPPPPASSAPPPPVGSAPPPPTNAPCMSASMCAAGYLCCVTSGAPGGVCQNAGTACPFLACMTSAECPAGEVCALNPPSSRNPPILGMVCLTPDAGSSASSDGGSDGASGPACISKCTQDVDCQMSCPLAPSGSVNCCDPSGFTCFLCSQPSCPAREAGAD